MNTKIYVAASSAEIARAEDASSFVRKWPGLTLTSHWIDCIQEVGESNPDTTDETRRAWSEEDLERVLSSDWFWVLLPKEPTRGLWFEWGFAWAHRIRIVTSGPNRSQSIFTSLSHRHFEKDEEVMAWFREAELL